MRTTGQREDKIQTAVRSVTYKVYATHRLALRVQVSRAERDITPVMESPASFAQKKLSFSLYGRFTGEWLEPVYST